jgi:hypothetical protein
LFCVRKIVHKSEYTQKNAISAGHPHTWAHGKLNAGMTTLHLDLHVLYDLDGQTMSFAPADCASV